MTQRNSFSPMDPINPSAGGMESAPLLFSSRILESEDSSKASHNVSGCSTAESDTTMAAIRRPGTARAVVAPLDSTAAAEPVKLQQTSSAEGSVTIATDKGFWVAVTNLDYHTTKKTLLDIFFPYGAGEAVLLPAPANSSTPSLRRSGYVWFSEENMATLAVNKLDDFIPCKQVTPIRVARVSSATVQTAIQSTRYTALAASPRSASNAAELSLLVEMTSTTAGHVAHYIQSQADPERTALDIIEALDSTTLPKLEKYAVALASVKDPKTLRQALETSVVRALLACIVSTDAGVATQRKKKREGAKSSTADALAEDRPDTPEFTPDEDPVETSRRAASRRVNAGFLLGNLFLTGFVTGDPHEVACRLIRCGVNDISQLDAICGLVDTCAAIANPRSSAEFWALVARTTATQENDTLRRAFCERLAAQVERPRPSADRLNGSGATLNYSVQGEGKENASSHSCPDGSADLNLPASMLTKKRTDEARSRTVYVSRLSPDTTCVEFRRLLDKCGVVLKVRTCVEDGFTTLFGFVEMGSVGAAKELLKLDRLEHRGCRVRFSPAKMPIQDVEPEDAVTTADHQIIRLCQFALYTLPNETVYDLVMAKSFQARKPGAVKTSPVDVSGLEPQLVVGVKPQVTTGGLNGVGLTGTGKPGMSVRVGVPTTTTVSTPFSYGFPLTTNSFGNRPQQDFRGPTTSSWPVPTQPGGFHPY